MDEFELPVWYKGKEMQFPARLRRLGYIYKIEVELSGKTVIFERDEERNWRALIEPSSSNDKIDTELLRAIGDTLEQITE